MRADVGVSDADIIGKTIFEQNEQGHTKFKYTLPSGRVVESEWLNDDQRKKAREAWLGAVCDQLGVDKEEQRAKDKRVVEERKLKETQAVLADAHPFGNDNAPGRIVLTDGPPNKGVLIAGPVAASAGPDEYVRGQLRLAMLREATAADALTAAKREWEDASNAVARWGKLNDALGA